MSQSQVYLFLYDQSSTWSRISGQQCSWHAGISLYGKEYCYTAENGITAIEHKDNFKGAPLKRTFTLGMTDTSENDFLNKIKELMDKDFHVSKYNAINHNGSHFARALIQFLIEVDRLEPELEVYLNSPNGSSSNSFGCLIV